MKISLALGKREGLSLQTARGCVGTNLALPGFGSLMAGRKVGYPQAALTVVGFTLTVVFGLGFVVFALRNMATFWNPDSDQLELWLELWLRLKWPLLGFGMVALSWLWALTTNSAILREARKAGDSSKPPKLN